MFSNARSAFRFSNHLRNPLASSQWRHTRKTPPSTTVIIYRRTREKLRGSSLVENIRGLRNVVADCKSWSEGCGPFFSFFAARRPPFAPVPRQSPDEPDRWRRSHCAYPIVLNLEGCIPPPIPFPFFLPRVAFPSFSHIPRRERRSDYESARGRMVETCTGDQIYITLTRCKRICLTKNDNFAPYKCWQNCPFPQNARSTLFMLQLVISLCDPHMYSL